MAIKGAWLAKEQGFEEYSALNKWGNGSNPIHAVHGGAGRGIADHPTDTPPIDESMIDGFAPENVGYTDDVLQPLWGYNTGDGTADRPGVGEHQPNVTAIPDPYPSWGRKDGGAKIRAVKRGSDQTLTAKVDPVEDVAQGWINKDHDVEPQDSMDGDDSQIWMQTSRIQRDKVRSGSQRGLGSDNTFDAPVKQRIPGMRWRHWSGGDRHEEMLPKDQNTVIRGFWNRTAGVGRVADMRVNEMYRTEPMQRVTPDSPYVGSDSPGAAYVGYDVTGNEHGYTVEDVVY